MEDVRPLALMLAVHLTADSCQVAEIERGRRTGYTHDILKPREIRPA